MRWEFLREEEFPAAIEKAGGLCVIPVGCLEMHGEHLPVGTDSLKGEAIVRIAAEKTGAVVFPCAYWLGDVMGAHKLQNPWEKRRAGYIGLSPELLLQIFTELCDEIGRNGFRKILLLNSHGGNVWMLDHFLRCQAYTNKGYSTMWAWAVDDDLTEPDRLLAEFEKRPEDFPMITPEDIAVLEGWTKTGYGGGHADFRETALVMADRPELVAPDRYEAEDGRYNDRADHIMQEGLRIQGWAYAQSPNYYNGLPPHGASQSIGQAMKKINVERLVRIMNRVKADEDCIRIAQRLPKLGD